MRPPPPSSSSSLSAILLVSTNLLGHQIAIFCACEVCLTALFMLFRVVNNQLSGAQKAQIELIDYLYRLSNYLYQFNSSLIR